MAQEITLYYKANRPLTPTRAEFRRVIGEQLGGKRSLKR
jgi:hypothetical protein